MSARRVRHRAAIYLQEARSQRNGTTHSWETFRRAATLAAEETAFWLAQSMEPTGTHGDSAKAFVNAAAWKLLVERADRALAAGVR